MATNWVTSLLEHGTDRAFSNLYEVEISRTGTSPSSWNFDNAKYLAEQVSFGTFSINTDYNKSFLSHVIKEIDKLKTINITFRETSSFETTRALKGWMNEIYDFDKNQFRYFAGQLSPYAKVIITFDEPSEGKSILLKEVLPLSITYPTLSWNVGDPIKIESVLGFNSIKFFVDGEEYV